ncbi:CinA family protein [Thioalkalivibrio sp. XN279]|uniref:CinA family protein n=1 Tax=Thioalkalivibrio sp. XN279 TaxID=2714953 RepID=UPI0014090B78|nr:CinA family protein [Thioalkalivibrio sp. XN279]NHA16023.1 CinA family protein [Thioalkalivibrio sp. XN279]
MIPDDERLIKLAREVGVWLAARDERLATAESCTAGWIAKAMTDVPGSSEWFIGGIASYADEAKTTLLGVPAAVIEKDGAVSQAVVEAMARGAIERTGANRAVAVSGIAGPAGGTPEKPVGTVWFAWARRDGEEIKVKTRLEHYQGDREGIRRQAVGRALAGVMMS